MLIDFKDEDFDSKIKNEDVSVIQFSAAWCGPCKALKPVMDKLADEYKGKAGFYYADVEDGGINTGSAAGIRGVPTVIIYKKGKLQKKSHKLKTKKIYFLRKLCMRNLFQTKILLYSKLGTVHHGKIN